MAQKIGPGRRWRQQRLSAKCRDSANGSANRLGSRAIQGYLLVQTDGHSMTIRVSYRAWSPERAPLS